VPAGINSLLDSLPARVSIQGLPFDAVFTYAVYTLNYVVVKVRACLRSPARSLIAVPLVSPDVSTALRPQHNLACAEKKALLPLPLCRDTARLPCPLSPPQA
jgi:hypothetical protein